MEPASKKKQFATMMSCCCTCSQAANKDIESAQHHQPRRRRRQCRLQCGLAWLPICTSIIGLTTILVTYLFAVGYDHIPPLLPYISDTGVEYPESSIFSLFLDLVAALLITTMYVRYKLIGQYHYKLEEEECFRRIGRVNRAGLVIGVISAAGLVMLANFPEDENLMAHLMGAFFCFTAGVAYCFMHTWLSFKTSPALSPPFMCFLRLSLASFAALTTALVIFFGTALHWHADDCHPVLPFVKPGLKTGVDQSDLPVELIVATWREFLSIVPGSSSRSGNVWVQRLNPCSRTKCPPELYYHHQ